MGNFAPTREARQPTQKSHQEALRAIDGEGSDVLSCLSPDNFLKVDRKMIKAEGPKAHSA
jgi:hypothetical protein